MASASGTTEFASGGGVFCAVCGSNFSSNKGLGLHMSKAHKEKYNDGIVVDRVNKRWTDEEVRLLADAEIGLSGSQSAKEINKALFRQLPSRTLEAIKSKRRTMTYKKIIEGLSVGPSTVPSSVPILRQSSARADFGNNNPIVSPSLNVSPTIPASAPPSLFPVFSPVIFDVSLDSSENTEPVELLDLEMDALADELGELVDSPPPPPACRSTTNPHSTLQAGAG